MKIQLILSTAALFAASALAQPICPSDCDRNTSVSVSELVRAVNILLGAPLSLCTAADVDGNGSVTVSELIQAVNASSYGCFVTPPTRTPTPRATSTPSPTRTEVGQGPQLSNLVLAEGNDPTELETCRELGSSNAIHYEVDYLGNVVNGKLRRRTVTSPRREVSELEFEIDVEPGSEESGRLAHWFCYLPQLDVDEISVETTLVTADGQISNTIEETIAAAEPQEPRLSTPEARYASSAQELRPCTDFGFPGGYFLTLRYQGRWDAGDALLVQTASAMGNTDVIQDFVPSGAYSREAGTIAIIQCLNTERFDVDVRIEAQLQFRDGDRSNTAATFLRR